MDEVTKLKEAIPVEEKPKPKFLKGQADTPGGLRMMFSIDERYVLTRHSVLDLLLDEFATTLNLAAMNETIAIEMLNAMRQANESLIVRVMPAAPPVE